MIAATLIVDPAPSASSLCYSSVQHGAEEDLMAKRGIRMMLWLVLVLSAAATGYLFWIDETRTVRDARAAHAFTESAHAAARAVLDVRAAQQAYVATGQGDEFWGSKVTASLAAARQAIGTMRGTSNPATGGAVQNAATTLRDFEQMDGRVREYVRSGQHLMASDVIFSDGLEMTEAIWKDIQRARLAEQQAGDAALRTIRQRQRITLAAGALGLCLLALLLVPVPRPKVEAERATPVRDTLDLRLTPDEHPRKPPQSHPTRVPALEQPERRPLDPTAVARLCTDLARMTDTDALPGLLDRAAEVLDAAGIVLWIADPDARELAPILAHGYSAQLVTRLGTIARDAENVTAAAFRTGLPQTVKADAVSNGAIAAPLMTPVGCVGVMAAEMRDGGEQQESRLAAATIIAAQLATLVGPPAARGNTAEAAG
jgi:hypothetical protein